MNKQLNKSNRRRHQRGSSRLKQIEPTLLFGFVVALAGMILSPQPVFALSPGDIAMFGVRADDTDVKRKVRAILAKALTVTVPPIR